MEPESGGNMKEELIAIIEKILNVGQNEKNIHIESAKENGEELVVYYVFLLKDWHSLVCRGVLSDASFLERFDEFKLHPFYDRYLSLSQCERSPKSAFVEK